MLVLAITCRETKSLSLDVVVEQSLPLGVEVVHHVLSLGNLLCKLVKGLAISDGSLVELSLGLHSQLLSLHWVESLPFVESIMKVTAD